MEHYSELYSRENQVTDSTLNAIKSLPTLVELDNEPTLSEIKDALKWQKANGKKHLEMTTYQLK
jgi:hypothetical protein